MNNTDKLIISNFEDRFRQATSVKEYIDKLAEKNIEIINKVKESDEKPEKLTKVFAEFKKNEVQMSMLEQQKHSLLARVLEYYPLIKGLDLPTSLSKEEKANLDDMAKEKIDLYAVDKGELVILNGEFHDSVMSRINTLQPGEAEQIYEYIKSIK